MVVDIQGMKNHNEFILTDPSIHCTDMSKYGDGNFGDKGFDEFFKTHQCNQLCKALGLPRHSAQVEPDIETASAIRPSSLASRSPVYTTAAPALVGRAFVRERAVPASPRERAVPAPRRAVDPPAPPRRYARADDGLWRAYSDYAE